MASELALLGGKPTRIANADRDVRELDKNLPASQKFAQRAYSIPWFKHYRPALIEQYANAFKKVAANYCDLLADDPGNPLMIGHWHFFASRK
ncbi:hypothetical protein FACS1894147_01400 [Spirochaetia bacterium]|nr:hypothetical protein FACS1894147_01400 [Spirochaetia bacterium]